MSHSPDAPHELPLVRHLDDARRSEVLGAGPTRALAEWIDD